MAEPISIEGQRAWLKHYGESSRALALGLLNFVARRFRLDALRPPPHRGGAQAREVEARRLLELKAQGVNVPAVIGEGKAALLLEHTGASFNTCLREADAAGRDRLVAAAIAAIASAHRDGAYFGQPLPRNMTWDGHSVGFIDFEEDPLEVMDLDRAQARDWLMFGYGVAKYYETRPQVLEAMLAEAMEGADRPVVDHAHEVTGRLQALARLLQRAGKSGQALARAILVVHSATAFGFLALVVLSLDWLADGELDLLALLT
ncbi:serine/threonine protein phosphatase [Stenotrophomonas mori]|uniref:Serine/threonine protein phosphatase n=1 Tax=Stenotrophomonas mori TaxID=2871096 RepID=A0ABT0SGD4_9GAMM|nr:serine/threonine protein phosphatase [Stenotrophomonas mori]MCL7714389.1 serine/threonine protein phosphatase [Stenotrophomonas mori]